MSNLVLRLVVSLEELTTVNSTIHTNRGNRYRAAKETKQIRDAMHAKVLNYLETNGIQTIYDAQYRRRGSKKLTPLMRAEKPLIDGYARVLICFYNTQRDIDGSYTKPLFDALEDARIFVNDKKIVELIFRKIMRRDGQGARACLSVYRLENDEVK